MLRHLESFRDRRVLITGGLGFIGSNLAHRLHGAGAQVTVYDCLEPRSGGNRYNLHGIGRGVRLLSGDIRDLEAVCEAVRGQDVVFHCAACTSHSNAMLEPMLDVDVNCKGTLHVLEAVRRHAPEAKLVHLGTSTQVGRMRRTPIDEDHPEYPLDIYSANKTASEKYVLIYGHAYGLRTTVVRLANVFGPRAHIRGPSLGFINYFIGLALQDRDLTIFGAGEQQRNVTYVDDAVEALLMAAAGERADGESLFATSDTHLTVAAIAAGIVRVIGAGRVRLVEWPSERRAIEFGDTQISNAKIRERLSWSPRHTFEEGLAQTRDYYRECLAHYLDVA